MYILFKDQTQVFLIFLVVNNFISFIEGTNLINNLLYCQ